MFDSALIVLSTLTHKLLLDVVDALVEVVLVLLALDTTSCGTVELVGQASEEAAAAAALLLLSFAAAAAHATLLVGMALLLSVVSAELAGSILEEVHG